MWRLATMLLGALLAFGANEGAKAGPATGFWWNPAEGGRGYMIEVQGSTLFLGGFIYDDSGKATWFVSTGPMTSDTQYSGTMIPYSGGQSLTGAFRQATAGASLGAIALTFSSTTKGTLTWPGGTIPIQRYDVVANGSTTAQPATNPASGWWWNAAEGGRGFALEVQGGTMFLVGYMYDASGAPVWYLTSGAMAATNLYSGAWTQYAGGQSITGAFRQATVSNPTVGPISLAFTGTGGANLTLPDGRGIALTRYAIGGASGGTAGGTSGGTSGGAFALTSSAAASGGILPADYTCDGTGSSPPLSWSNAPSGTKEFALLMTTLPGDGTTKWNWVVSGIPATATGIAKDAFGVGTAGVGSDGPFAGYQPPCSQGPGAKTYTFTLHALSGSPSLAGGAAAATGDVLTSALSSLSLGSATLSLSYTRSTATGSSTNCLNIRQSMAASTTGNASVACDGTYAYVSSGGIATHAMMTGITATNLQVPITQDFYGAKGWKIPLSPAIAATTTSVEDGPIGVAINGVPIFNPCKQGGCQNGDTKALGELDACNGHAGRADDYHYHAAPTCVMAGKSSNYWDTHPIGWALDGFAIFGYNDATGVTAARDSICGGNTSAVSNAPAGYAYHVTDASPYVLACLRGTPSPDLANQGSKYSPIRQPPVTPFAVSAMTLSTDASDGFKVLQFTSARSFQTTETGADTYANAAGTYRIRYAPVTGSALATLLAQTANAGKSACWTFQFQTSAGTKTQPDVSYCR